MGYIYCILYRRSYNEKYQDYLSKEFARIPFVPSKELFEKMSDLGWNLIQKHLCEDVSALGLGTFLGIGSNRIEKVFYKESEQKLYINATQFFEKVPQNVFAFNLGSYPVLAKYLKARKDRILTLEEVNHVENVINILAFTLRCVHDQFTNKERVHPSWYFLFFTLHKPGASSKAQLQQPSFDRLGSVCYDKYPTRPDNVSCHLLHAPQRYECLK